MKNRKWIALAVSALLSVTALPTMAFAEAAATEAVKEATKKSAKELTEITLNEVAHSIFYAPQYVAIEEGYFAEEGIDLTLVTGFGADKVMTALLSGEAEIGFMGSEASIYTYSGGAGDAPVNFAQLTQRAGNFLVAREEMPDFTWADLIGKDVLGGRKGGMPQMVFEYILRQNGIDPSEVQIDQSIDFGSTAAAFSSGKGDFTVEFEPGATTLEQEGVGTVVASLGTDSGYVPYTAYCTKSGYLSDGLYLKTGSDRISGYTGHSQGKKQAWGVYGQRSGADPKGGRCRALARRADRLHRERRAAHCRAAQKVEDAGYPDYE